MRDSRKRIVTVAASTVVCLAAVAALMLAGLETGFSGTVLVGPLGWIAPLVTVLVVGAAAWALLGDAEPGVNDGSAMHTEPCGSCGRDVLEGWRMCPYCGAWLERARTAHPVETPTD
jgi:hypothetical protein